MPRTRIKPPKGTVFVCPDFCGFQSRPLVNDDSESKANSPFKCPSCGRVGSLITWTRPWYKVDTPWQSLVEYFRLLIWRWRRSYCQNLAKYTLIKDRRGVYSLRDKLAPSVKMQCERGMPFVYSSRSFEGSGWTEVLLCEQCVAELADAGRQLSESFRKQQTIDAPCDA